MACTPGTLGIWYPEPDFCRILGQSDVKSIKLGWMVSLGKSHALMKWNKIFLPPFIAYFICLSHYRRLISVIYESPFFRKSVNRHSWTALCGCKQYEYYFLQSASMCYVLAIPAVIKILGTRSCWQPTSLRMFILM